MKSITDKYLKSLYTNIGAELEELVFKVELLPHTTKNNYGRYMKLLTICLSSPPIAVNRLFKYLSVIDFIFFPFSYKGASFLAPSISYRILQSFYL